jgi:transketolase
MVTQASLANALRVLAMDGIQAANSGHPGAPMGMAEMAVALWHRHLKHNPADPKWPNRDRFVLSNGHASILLYSLLHLTGYDLSLDDIKCFRQLHGKTPGHPEYGHTVGVETTTGPLGQGLGNSVGFALAERLLADEFNREGFSIVDHYCYAFVGDGSLMEGISHEACSLAGTWKLAKLIALYDDNGISIDGHVTGWFTDDTPKRFEAYGWNVIRGVDGHDVDAVDRAIRSAKAQHDKPTLICCRTVIGQGSPNKAGTHGVHAAPLGTEEIAATRAALGITEGAFEIPEAVRAVWNGLETGAKCQAEWQERFATYRSVYPALAAEFERRLKGDLPAGYAAKATETLQAIATNGEMIAARKSSQNAIQALAPVMPELVGGSADLTPANLTQWEGCRVLRPDAMNEGGNYIHYGVREFGMAAIMNGLALYGSFRPFGGTLLMFSEYARNAIRMAALMKINPIYVFTHDSVGIGEDGPTHQPIEQTVTLRAVPNLDVWRPCDSVETFVAWQMAIEHRSTPTALILSRHDLPHQVRDSRQIAAIRRGGYVLKEASGTLQAIIIATGSEVGLAMTAQQKLAEKGIAVRVISLPSSFIFDRQDAPYREAVLPRGVPRVAVEAGVTDYWRKYVGLDGSVVGIDRFGECGPTNQVFEFLGMTVSNVIAAVESVILN